MSLEKVKGAVQYYRTFNASERKDFHATKHTARARYLGEFIRTIENNQVLLGEFQKGVDEYDKLADTWEKRRQDAEEHDLHTVKRP